MEHLIRELNQYVAVRYSKKHFIAALEIVFGTFSVAMLVLLLVAKLAEGN